MNNLIEHLPPSKKSKNVALVGQWLHDILPPNELLKLMEHYKRVAEPDTKVTLTFEINLFELETLKMGYIPKSRNCLEILNG
jgi:hypothetical protein